MKKFWKTLIITSVFVLLPILAGLILWDKLPDPMPSHWNAKGEVDGYSSKFFGVIGLPLLMLFFHFIVAFATLADPKSRNHSDKILRFVFWLMPIITIFTSAFTMGSALGYSFRGEIFIPMLVGVILFIVGIILPSCKQNYTVGIKLPWTLNSEENWNRTHRLAGPVWMIAGAVMAFSGFFGSIWPTLAVCFFATFVPCIYSYILYRKGI